MELLVNEGKRQGTLIPVTGTVFVIGRDEACQLRPRAAEVSRFHAELKLGPGGVTIRDLGSSNGTMVNGRRLGDACPLRHGDRLEIGPLSFTVVIRPTAPVKRRRRLGEDAVAAWLIGEPPGDSESAGGEVPPGATAVPGSGTGGPRELPDPAVPSPPSDSGDEAYDLLQSMSLADRDIP